MARTRINLDLYAGDKNQKTLQVLMGGDPWDLTGATVTAQARKTPTDPTVALTGAVVPIDAAQGIYTVSWDGNDVRELLGGEASWTGVWDLEVLEDGEAEGDAVTVADGAVLASMDVTRGA